VRDYQRRNSETISKKKKAYREANADHLVEYFHQYNLSHQEEKRIYNREWRARNRERKRLANKLWEAENKDRARQCYYDYRKRNRDKAASWAQNRASRKRGAEGQFTAADIQRIFKLQSGRCAYCRIKLKLSKVSRDHIVSLAKGGTNHPRNLQVLCPLCNSRKSCKDPIDFARELGMLL